MRILRYCILLAVAMAVVTGCDKPAENGKTAATGNNGTPEKKSAPEIPTDEEIFAVTMCEMPLRNLNTIGSHQTDTAGAKEIPWVYSGLPADMVYEKFTITEEDVRNMLRTCHRITHEQWMRSLPALITEKSGWLILKNGQCIQWAVRPDGMAWLRFASGDMIYLSQAALPTASTLPEIPADDDIFAITMWNRSLPLRELINHEYESRTKDAVWTEIGPLSDYWKGKFSVTEKDLRKILRTYHRVTHEQWKYFSHVGGGDLSGWLVLKNGQCIQWMVKPGGLAWLRFANGNVIYLSQTSPPSASTVAQ